MTKSRAKLPVAFRTRGEAAAYFGASERTIGTWLTAGCPGHRGRYPRLAMEAWRQRRYGKTDELLLSGPTSPGLERLRLAKAQREELALARDRGLWLRREDVHALLVTFASLIRQAGETLQKQFGREARDILVDAVTDADAACQRFFGNQQGPAVATGEALVK